MTRGRHALRPGSPAGHAEIRAGARLLRDELRPHRGQLVRLLVWSVLEGLPALMAGAVVAAALDEGFLAERPATGFAFLGLLGMAMLLRAGATYAMFPHLAAVVEPLRDALVRRVVRGALAEAGGARPADAGAAVARLTEQVESCRNLTASLLRTLRQIAVTVVAAAVGVALLAPEAILLVVVPLVAAASLFARMFPPLARRRRDLLLADEAVSAEVGRAVTAIRDVVACGARERAEREVGRSVDAQAHATRMLARASAARLLVVAVGGQLPLVAVLVAAPWLVSSGRLSTGEVAGVAVCLVQYLEPAVRTVTATVSGWLLELAVVAGRLATAATAPQDGPVKNSAPDPTGGPTPDAPAPETLTTPGDSPAGAMAPPAARRCAITARGVTFAHGPYAEPVVANLDLALRRGGHLAIVGPSGTGKSTLAGLLAGLERPDRGRLFLGTRPMDTLTPDQLRAEITLVPQEAYVFAGTVRENLAYLAPEVTDRELEGAMRLLGCRELVARLGGPSGHIARPAELASGERQLLCLVRAFVSPAPIVILDEATCHLDPAAEALVEMAFANRVGTLVVIAHRMESARRADQVLLMDGGRPLLGTHAELLARSDLYAELFGRWGGGERTAARAPHRPAGQAFAPSRTSVKP